MHSVRGKTACSTWGNPEPFVSGHSVSIVNSTRSRQAQGRKKHLLVNSTRACGALLQSAWQECNKTYLHAVSQCIFSLITQHFRAARLSTKARTNGSSFTLSLSVRFSFLRHPENPSGISPITTFYTNLVSEFTLQFCCLSCAEVLPRSFIFILLTYKAGYCHLQSLWKC